MPNPLKWIDTDAYLFDIDGTLLNAYGGAHYNAFHSALEYTFHITSKIDGVPLHGNTDIGILRAVLRREGIDDKQLDLRLPEVVEHMCSHVELHRQQIRAEVCPAIPELLGVLSSRCRLLAVASGNFERIGWMKLEVAGLRHQFAFGSFSDSRELRKDIFQAGVAEVQRRLGPEATTCVVGDTPADILAAKAVGVPVIAVATGIYKYEDLVSHSPDVCVSACTELVDVLPVSQDRA